MGGDRINTTTIIELLYFKENLLHVSHKWCMAVFQFTITNSEGHYFSLSYYYYFYFLVGFYTGVVQLS